MGLADIRALREQTAQADLTDEALVSLNATLDDMAKDAVKEVSAQGLGDEKIDVYRRIHLRYDGTDSVIVVDLADAATMKENFEALHRQRFGFVPEGRKLVVEALAIEAVGITESTIDPEIEDVANRSAIQPISSVTMHSDGKNHETPVYSRDSSSQAIPLRARPSLPKIPAPRLLSLIGRPA